MTTNPNPHPMAFPGNRSGGFSLNTGDRFVYDIDGRHGWADEFLSDGDAFVTFDDGSHETIKWNQMSPETVKTETVPLSPPKDLGMPLRDADRAALAIFVDRYGWEAIGQALAAIAASQIARSGRTVIRDQFWRGAPKPIRGWAALSRSGKIMTRSVRDRAEDVRLACGECVPIPVTVSFGPEEQT